MCYYGVVPKDVEVGLEGRMSRSTSVAIFLLALPLWVFAQSQPSEPVAVNHAKGASPQEKKGEEHRYISHTEITVVAPPIEQSVKPTVQGTEVDVVTSQQVENLNAQDLASALRRVPGVVISRYDLIGSYGGADGGAIYIRGQGAGRPGAEIGTYIDGIPVFAGVWTHPVLDLFGTDMAGRIEVYKSPEPVLLGNMAFGGVNLVPKTMEIPGEEGRVEVTAGSYSTRIFVAEQGGHQGAFDYYAEGSLKRSDGQRPRADGRTGNAYAHLGAALDEHWRLELQTHYADGWADDPGPMGQPLPPVAQRFSASDTLGIATLVNRFDRASGFLKLYYNDGSIDWRQWDASAGQPFWGVTDFNNYGAKAQESWEPWRGGRLVAGFDHDVYGGSYTEPHAAYTYRFPRTSFRTDAPYLLLSQSFGSEVVVTPALGVRYASSDTFESEWGGQAAVTVAWRGQRLHAGISRSFNLPGLYTALMYSQWHRGQQWQNLKAEVLKHMEVGYSCGFGRGVVADLTYFYDRDERALRFVPPPPFPPSFANLGTFSVRGAEADLRIEGRGAWSAYLGGTYSRPIPISVPEVPRRTLSAGFVCRVGQRWQLSTDAQYVDHHLFYNPRYASTGLEIGSYALWNAKASVRLTPERSPLEGELFVAGENLLDRKYEFRPGYPMPGSTAMVGLNARW